MAEEEARGSCPAPEPREDFEVIDRTQVPGPAELKRDGQEKGPEEAGWSAPVFFSLAKKASENLAASCGSALKSAASVGLMPKPVSNDSPAAGPRMEPFGNVGAAQEGPSPCDSLLRHSQNLHQELCCLK